MMKDPLGFGLENVLDINGYKNHRTKIDEGEDGGPRINVVTEREKITPLGGDSKISEEDPPL